MTPDVHLWAIGYDDMARTATGLSRSPALKFGD